MFVGTVQLLNVGWAVEHGTVVPPGMKQDEAIDIVVLAFIDPENGMRVEIPMPPEYAAKLAADLDGRQIIVARPGAGPNGIVLP